MYSIRRFSTMMDYVTQGADMVSGYGDKLNSYLPPAVVPATGASLLGGGIAYGANALKRQRAADMEDAQAVAELMEYIGYHGGRNSMKPRVRAAAALGAGGGLAGGVLLGQQSQRK
jgi:hypothetical protein